MKGIKVIQVMMDVCDATYLSNVSIAELLTIKLMHHLELILNLG